MEKAHFLYRNMRRKCCFLRPALLFSGAAISALMLGVWFVFLIKTDFVAASRVSTFFAITCTSLIGLMLFVGIRYTSAMLTSAIDYLNWINKIVIERKSFPQ